MRAFRLGLVWCSGSLDWSVADTGQGSSACPVREELLSKDTTADDKRAQGGRGTGDTYHLVLRRRKKQGEKMERTGTVISQGGKPNVQDMLILLMTVTPGGPPSRGGTGTCAGQGGSPGLTRAARRAEDCTQKP